MNQSETGAEILIVEDSPTQALKLQFLLEENNYNTTIARDGQAGFDALTSGDYRPALVISDVEMPRMTGYELCRSIKTDAGLSSLPVILLTSLSDPRDVVQGLDCGADTFMVKPFNEEFLLARIAYMLENVSAGPDGLDDGGVDVFLAGEKYRLSSQPSIETAVGLLLGTYEIAAQKNRELTEAKDSLEKQAEELARSNAALKRTTDELRSRNEHMEADLHLACEIQNAFMPRRYPTFPHFSPVEQSALQFCHRWIPTTTLGGDFFDVLALSDTMAGVFICDVMGHGVRSALVTAMMRALVGERSAVTSDPGRFMAEINKHLLDILQQTKTPMFASAFYGVLDTSNGELIYANAGHPSPLWVHGESGIVEPLPYAEQTSGPALGVFDEATYDTAQNTLASGDALLLFTDGLFEVEGTEGEYGEERLYDAVRRHRKLSLSPMFDNLLSDIKAFSGQEEFEDDVCLIGLEVTRVGR